MKIKKQYVSSIFTVLAMILLLVSRIIGNEAMDWIGYLAILVIIVSVVSMITLNRPSK